MPYFRCPACGLLAHVDADDPAAIDCTRCEGLGKHETLEPVEESLRITRPRRDRPAREPAD